MSGQGKESDEVEAALPAEARERLASLETRQETLEGKADDLKDGQGEIIDRLTDLDEKYVGDDEMSEVKEKVEKNSATRNKAVAAAKLITLTLTLSAGISGAVVTLM